MKIDFYKRTSLANIEMAPNMRHCKHMTCRCSGDNVFVSLKGHKKVCISEVKFLAEQIGND
jgi:hypothetical protein